MPQPYDPFTGIYNYPGGYFYNNVNTQNSSCKEIGLSWLRSNNGIDIVIPYFQLTRIKHCLDDINQNFIPIKWTINHSCENYAKGRNYVHISISSESLHQRNFEILMDVLCFLLKRLFDNHAELLGDNYKTLSSKDTLFTLNFTRDLKVARIYSRIVSNSGSIYKTGEYSGIQLANISITTNGLFSLIWQLLKLEGENWAKQLNSIVNPDYAIHVAPTVFGAAINEQELFMFKHNNLINVTKSILWDDPINYWIVNGCKTQNVAKLPRNSYYSGSFFYQFVQLS